MRCSPIRFKGAFVVVFLLSLSLPDETSALTQKIVLPAPGAVGVAMASGSMTPSASTSMNDNSYSLTSDAHNSTEDDNSPYKTASYVCGVLIVPTALIGIAGNLLSIYVFTRRGMICSINTLLTGLAAIDCLLLMISMPTFSLVALNAESSPTVKLISDALVLYAYPVAAMAQNASVWCLVVITLERYVAVVFPLRSRYICTTRNARLALLAVTAAAVIYNVCRFFEYSWQQDGKLCNWLKNDLYYLRIYTHWLYFIVTFLVPFSVLLIFNGFIIKGVRRARVHRAELTRQESQEHKVALMMVVLILIFFACNSLAFVLNAVESTQPEGCFTMDQCSGDFPTTSTSAPTIATTELTVNVSSTTPNEEQYCYITTLPFYFAVDLNNLLVEINSSVNFFIYYAFSQRFRKYLRRLCLCVSSLLSKGDHRKSANGRRRSAMTSDIGFEQHMTNGFTERTSAAERSPMLTKASNNKLKMSRTFSERSSRLS